MADLLTGLPFTGVSATALLGIWVLLVMLGVLPTPGQVKDLRQQVTDKGGESERWRTAYENERDARLENSRQLEKLVEKTDLAAARDELVVSLLQSIRDKAVLP